MAEDETLDEFVQILGRIRELLGESTVLAENGFDLDAEIERLRLAGNNKDADELAELHVRADELKVEHQAKS
jgi:hypothetical protein